MSDHTDCSPESRSLCDALFSGLRGRIPQLNRSQSLRWCAFFSSARNRFAYINHRKRMSRIQIWCLGEPAVLISATNLLVELRTPTTGGFAKQFQAKFFLDDILDIDAAVQLLYDVSFRMS